MISAELQFPQTCQSKQETKDEELHQRCHKINKMLNGVTAAITNGMLARYYTVLLISLVWIYSIHIGKAWSNATWSHVTHIYSTENTISLSSAIIKKLTVIVYWTRQNQETNDWNSCLFWSEKKIWEYSLQKILSLKERSE